jgi:Domain of unknown function (DUF5063)
MTNDWKIEQARFSSIAVRYCSLVDSAAELSRTQLLVALYRILPDLLSEAIRLPDTDAHDREGKDEPNEDLAPKLKHPSVSDSDWSNLYQSLRQKLGDADLYQEIFNPIEGKDSVTASLADDIADIYRDLRNGLSLATVEAASPADVIWEWRFGFYSHWGNHSMNALRTMHHILGGYFDEGL